MTKIRKATQLEPAVAAAPATSAGRDYRVLQAGWVAGRRVKEGDILQLTEVEARYEPVELVTAATSGRKDTVSE